LATGDIVKIVIIFGWLSATIAQEDAK